MLKLLLTQFRSNLDCAKWEFPEIRGTFLRAPRMRTIVFGVHIGVLLSWEPTNGTSKVVARGQARGLKM